MTEEDCFEEGIVPEVMPAKQLDLIINESGIDVQLALEFQANFYEHFKMASTWAKKAKNIIVTNENQTVIMAEARTARLFLRSKRLEIESFRVSKKEYYLKGGRAIDKVANFLKDTIIPIEEHLDRQEHFVELKKAAEDKRILEEAYAKQQVEEQKRIAYEAKERERLQIENEKLRKEAEQKERTNQEELKKVREANEKILQAEREKTIKAEAELLAKRQGEANAEADRLRSEQILKSSGDTSKLIKFRQDLKILIDKFPEVTDNNLVRISEDAKSYLWLAYSTLNQINEEEI